MIITGSLPPMSCGVGDYTKRLAEELASDLNHEVIVLTSQGVFNDIFKFKVLSEILNWSILESLKYILILKKNKPDLIHIQFPTQGYGRGLLPFFIPFINFIFRVKTVQTWHEVYSLKFLPLVFFKSIFSGSIIITREKYSTYLSKFFRFFLFKKKFHYIAVASNLPPVNLSKHSFSEVKSFYQKNQSRLIVFFGFIYPNKGIELIFSIADPSKDQIVIAGNFGLNVDYNNQIHKLAFSKFWKGKVLITGSLPEIEASKLLSVADTIILPFRNGVTGGGESNGSIHAATTSGSFVITTSDEIEGYDKERNIYFAKIDDVSDMRYALEKYSSFKNVLNSLEIFKNQWLLIKTKHELVYSSIQSINI
ncbi:glycosyltransferase [Candidatus Methylopumilus universalis]|uniref:glycosyltransferase n=1 Tax=Candidatus Methylopumilus universalis TaxID=2588536 RepID=UPI003BEED319